MSDAGTYTEGEGTSQNLGARLDSLGSAMADIMDELDALEEKKDAIYAEANEILVQLERLWGR